MHFWRFTSPSDVGLVPMEGSYTPALVLLSYLVSVLASGSSLAVVPRITLTGSPGARWTWLAIGAFAAGAGVWAMHFTAMLAFNLPLAVEYDPWITGLSALPPILGGGASIGLIAVARPGWVRIVFAGLVMALGIGTMHYLGMEAMRADMMMGYDPLLFLMSIAVAWILATSALTVHTKLGTADESRPFWLTASGAAVAGAAVCGMHYTAMFAARFYSTAAPGVTSLPSSRLVLGGVIVTLASIFILLALVGVVVDRRLGEANASLAAGAERHEAVLQSMADGLVIFDEIGEVESSNNSASEMLGHEAATMQGLHVGDFLLFESDGVPLTAEDLGDFTIADSSSRNVVAKRIDGRRFPVDVRVRYMTIGDQDLTSVVLVDTSAQVAAATQTRRLVAAVDHATDSVFVLDRDGTVLYANPAFERVSGFKSSEVIGTKPSRENSEGTDGPERGEMWQAIDDGVLWSGALVSLRKDGTTYRTETTVSPIRDDAEQVTSYVVVERDITEQWELESQLQQAQKLESIGQLAAGIAHEINTPTQYVTDNTRFLEEAFVDLQVAIGELDQLRAAARDGTISPELLDRVDGAMKKADVEYLVEEIPRAIEQSLEGVGRVAKIVRAMKEFSHPGHEKTAVDLNQAIESTLTVATNEWKYVADLKTDFDPALPLVVCLPGEMNQVVLNMVVNAAHAIGDVVGDGGAGKGTITLSTELDGDWVEIRISDTGGGIPESARGKIFDPFFTTKDVGKGTGQGLSIAHSVVVQQHGGTLTFDTETGVGTTFIIRLPLVDTGAEREVALA